MTFYELFQLNKYSNVLGEPSPGEDENGALEADKFAEWAYHQEQQFLIELENQNHG